MNFHPKDHDTEVLTNDSIKGIFRSIGDAGDSPAHHSGQTLLEWQYSIHLEAYNRTNGKSVYASSSAASLSATLNVPGGYGKAFIEIWVKSSGAANFEVYGSRDNASWRKTDTISFSAAGETTKIYNNAYPYIKVSTTAANDNEIEIVSTA